MLSEYIDSSLSSENKSFVERHLQTCETCSKELESLRMTVQLLHRVTEVPVPRSFTVTVPQHRRESAFGPANLRRWLRPATAIVAIALVVLLMGDFLHAFENNAGVDRGPGNVTLSDGGQLAPSPVPTEPPIMVNVPGVIGQMSLATAKAVGYKDYTVVPSSPVSESITQPIPSIPGNEEITGAGVMAQGEAGVGWPLRQTEIGLGAAVFVLLARRQRTKGAGAG
jgi:hypothetical protein